jgi:Putative DNA-binding domain
LKLAERQARFLALISGEASAREDDYRGLRVPATLTPEAALRLYSEALHLKLADRLRAPYPKLASVLGDAPFAALIEAFVRTLPSPRRSAAAMVQALPDFLEERSAAWGRPDLSDLARLERARWDVGEEASAASVTCAALAAVPAADLGRVRLRLVPALRLIHLRFDVGEVWRALDEGLPATDPLPSATSFLAWRSGLEVFHARLRPDEGRSLSRLLAGATLGEAADAFADERDPAEAAYGAIRAWFDERLVMAVERA